MLIDLSHPDDAMISNEFVLAIVAGVALAVPYVLYARRRRQAFGIGLVVAASVYVIFAASRGTVRESSYAPWWYPVTGIGFDLIVAGAILGSSRTSCG